MPETRSFPTVTAESLVPAEVPTLFFIGVSTGRSAIQHVFPRWAQELGLGEARLQGVDLPLHARAEDYRRVVDFLAADPLSLGALVTTHKLDLFQATSDRFDEIDPLARLTGETSCISKRGPSLVCHAKDPISSGLALEAFVPAGHWAATGSSALVLGAGGSAVAISWYLTRPERGDDRPASVRVSDPSAARLEHLRELHEQLGTTVPLELVLADHDGVNDRLVAALPPGSLVVNATGLGKDGPGSPLTPAARFPEDGLVWELNYRGDLEFLRQARAQQAERRLSVQDGWTYFLHGWTQVIGEVFHIDIPTTGPAFERLSHLAGSAR